MLVRSQIDLLHPDLLDSPLRVSVGGHTCTIRYDRELNSVDIDGTRYALGRGRLFLVSSIGYDRPVFEQRAMAIDADRLRREGGPYLASVVESEKAK